MNVAFVELSAFSAVREEHFKGDENFRQFQVWLAIFPKSGTVMPGTGGLRKTRWYDASRGRGKRSGFRVIYLYIPEAAVIVLFTIYSKNVATDLSPEQKKSLTKAARSIREDFITWKNASEQR